LHKVGLPSQHLAYTNFAVWLIFSYVWLPFMILPVFGAVERIPHSYIEASEGPRSKRLRHVPARHPAARSAGSDRRVDLHLLADSRRLRDAASGRGASSQFIGNVVYESVGISNNVPFAAAFATVPLLVMAVYLVIARRLGAFEAM